MQLRNLAEEPVSDCLHCGLILVAFVSFTTGTLVHYPVSLMMLLGIAFIWKKPERECYAALKFVLLMYFIVWFPMLIATIDAVNLTRAVQTTLLYLHFVPVLVYLVVVGRREKIRRLVGYGLVALVFFGAVDALVQLTSGQNFFGYPYSHGLLTGVFHPKQRIGLFLAALVPLVLYISQSREMGKNMQLVLVSLLFVVILLSLKRSAWLMGLVAVVGYSFIYRKSEWFSFKRAFSFVVIFLFIGGVAFSFSKPLQKQIHNSFISPFSEVSEIDRASSHRISLWRTGLKIVSEHWINGIGPRGYRYIYKDYASNDDFWMRKGEGGQTHPHLLFLEVGVETGIVGLLSLVLFYAVLYRVLISPGLDPPGRAFVLCAGVAWLPFNMHMAFYGSYWSTFVWLLLGFGIAGYQTKEKTSQTKPPASRTSKPANKEMDMVPR